LEDSVRAIDLIRIVYRWRKAAALFFGLVVLGALVYCLLSPNEYTAVATLMPGSTPGEMNPMQNMASSFLNRFGVGGFFRGATINPSDVFANTLRSKFVARNVVNGLDLVEFFDIDEKEPARELEKGVKELKDITSVNVSDMLLISVAVTHKDRVMAAKIANAFLDELENANQQFSLSSAKKAREFVERRLATTEEALTEAQAKFTEFQQEHGAVALDEQSKATVEAVARLEGEILAMEAQRDALSATHTPSYSRLRELDLTIDALRNKVRGLIHSDYGDDTDDGRGVVSEEGVFIPLGDVPTISAEYARLMLGVKTQASVLEILVQQHEQLKIEEAKNVPTIQILDRAVPPIEKSRPYRTVIMIVAVLVGLVGGVVLALTLNYLEGEFDAGDRAELTDMRRSVVREVLARLPGRGSPPQDLTHSVK
jgi:uncharacterized protein involved in exopolysaccharide biosynthesis